MGEATRLRPVTVDLDRLVLQGGLNKTWDDHTILPRLTWTHSIKEPGNDDGQARFLVMSQREKLVERLCAGIGPTVLVGRTSQQVIFLFKGNGNTFAIDLRCAWYQNTLAIFGTPAKHDVGTVKNRLDGLDRLFHDQPNTDGAGHVIDAFRFADEFFHQLGIKHGIDDEPKRTVLFEMRNVGVASG